MGKHCCYGTCNSDSRYAEKTHMQGVFFIPFPKPKTMLDKCKSWIKACGRKGFGIENINKYTYICSKHFVGGAGPTPDHPHPLPAVATALEQQDAAKPVRKRPRDRQPLPSPKKINIEVNEEVEVQEDDVDLPDIDINNDEGELPPTILAEHDLHQQTKTNSTQTTISLSPLENTAENYELADKKSLLRKLFVYETITRTNKACMFYTGVTLVVLNFLFDFLKDKASRLTYWEGPRSMRPDVAQTPESKKEKRPVRTLTLREEFIMTLLRIRRGATNQQAADLFGISSSQASKIFCTWITFLCLELGPLLIRWPTKEQVMQTLPASFKYFKKTRCIIDCTEIFIQKPSMPSSQRITWSQYKHNNTCKLLVGTSPRGTITYLSSLWTGSISDKRIVQESGFLNYIEHGDDIMADRGFLIRDLLAEKGATLNIPPFAHGKQLSADATTKTRRIASARIHVERAIGRLKTFRLLNGIVPLSLKPLLNQIVVVSAALWNLQEPLNK